MEETESIEWKKTLESVKDIFSIDDAAKYLKQENMALLIVLDYVKAKDWPRKGKALLNEPVKTIPLVWALLTATDDDRLRVNYAVHPSKCFPSYYNRYNTNSITSPAPLHRGWAGKLGGCSRGYVRIRGRRYEVSEKTPEYCSIFGMPDDCYDPSFEKKMMKAIRNLKHLEIWCYEKTDYLRNAVEPHLKIRYMKEEFLPSRHFIYTEASEDFLKGIYTSRDMKDLNEELWYTQGKEFIEERNLNDRDACHRFEREALYYVRKRIIHEFLRLILLVTNRERFSEYVSSGPPKLDPDREEKSALALEQLVRLAAQDSQSYLNTLLSTIKSNLMRSFSGARFLVMDVEHIPVRYPSESPDRIFNFPCIFSSILWLGPKKGPQVHINALRLPCHACREDCRPFKRNILKFPCLSYGHDFLDRQISIFEELLARYEGFKIYSYGKSDIFQLEYGSNFFSDTFQMRRFERRNRKRSLRLVDIHEDLSINDKSLDEIEKDVLEKWLKGWKRRYSHVQVNRRFMIRFDSNRWKSSCLEAVDSSMSDCASAFLLLVYERFLSLKDEIKVPMQMELFDAI